VSDVPEKVLLVGGSRGDAARTALSDLSVVSVADAYAALGMLRAEDLDVVVLADVEGARSWSSAGISEAKLLSKSVNKLEYYQYLDVPSWTMSSDRFWFLQSTLESGAERAALRWSPLVNGGAHAAYYAEVKAAHPDAIEPTANVGSWVFERQSDGTHVTYSVCTLPGGSIPTMVQNAATRKTLPDTVGDAVRAARKR
jgi:hypothetical protein